jgi:hypothetical protein
MHKINVVYSIRKGDFWLWWCEKIAFGSVGGMGRYVVGACCYKLNEDIV